MKAAIKSAIEKTLIASGLAALARRRVRDQTLILAYHNIVPQGESVRGDLSLHLPQRRFATQLDVLARLGQVIPLADALIPSPGQRPRFVITFDDAYAGAMSAGVDELRRRGMPATVFVAPALLGLTTWWDMIADPGTGAVPDAKRDHALSALAGRRDQVLAWAGTSDDGSSVPRIATLVELSTAMQYDKLTLGSHTLSHVNLSAVEGAELDRELREPSEWLAASFGGRYLPWLSYPYGLASNAVEQRAPTHGYLAGVRVEGGWMAPDQASNRFALPRSNIPSGLSDAGFELRASGIGTR